MLTIILSSNISDIANYLATITANYIVYLDKVECMNLRGLE